MRKKLKGIAKCVALMLTFMLVFTACSANKEKEETSTTKPTTTTQAADQNNNQSESVKEVNEPVEEIKDPVVTMDPVTLNIRIMNEVANIDQVIAIFNEQTKDDPILSNIDLNIGFVPGGDYKDMVSMLMAAQDEDIDLMFIGGWHGLNTFARQGLLTDLSGYFNNPNYPGLMTSFSKGFVDAAKTYIQNADGSYSTKLFNIPLAEALNDIRGLNYREDLRVKYGIPEITNDDILMQYLQAVVENEPNMFGWSMYNGFFYMDSPFYSAQHSNLYPLEIIGQEAPIYVAVSADGKTVIDAVVMGDTQEHFDNMPNGYQYDFFKEYHLDRLKWAPYLDPSRGTTDVTTGWAAVTYSTVSNHLANIKDMKLDEALMSEYPDAQLRFYVTEEDQRNMQKGAIVSEMKSNNFICVPEWSKNVDATMCFLDWMFGSKANHDLFQYGVEGVHWTAVGDDAFRTITLPDSEQYKMPGYSFTWNPSYIRYNEDALANVELKALLDYQNSPDAYKVSAISGFAFNPENVTTQIANVSTLSNDLLLRYALYGDETEAKIDEWYADAVSVGFEDIRTELINQLQEFLDMKDTAN